MNADALTRDVYYALNKELLRRMLIKYFFEKGFKEDMDRRVYPPNLQDFIMKVPQLTGKVELVPHVEDVDPQTNTVKLGWNLFILGTKRMYLGESSHTSLSEVKCNISGPIWSEGINSINYTTPKKIINFVVQVLGDSKSGDLARAPKQYKDKFMPMYNNNDQSGYFRTQGRPVL